MDDQVTIEDFSHDICREFDCHATENCGGRFWCDTCVFYNWHITLNGVPDEN